MSLFSYNVVLDKIDVFFYKKYYPFITLFSYNVILNKIDLFFYRGAAVSYNVFSPYSIPSLNIQSTFFSSLPLSLLGGNNLFFFLNKIGNILKIGYIGIYYYFFSYGGYFFLYTLHTFIFFLFFLIIIILFSISSSYFFLSLISLQSRFSYARFSYVFLLGYRGLIEICLGVS